jgi:hypothetical protein
MTMTDMVTPTTTISGFWPSIVGRTGERWMIGSRGVDALLLKNDAEVMVLVDRVGGQQL